MTVRQRIATVAATLAILGGMTSVALAQSEGSIGRGVRDTGILVALGGLLTALGTQVQPIIRIYLDNQRLQFDVQTAVNRAAAERHMLLERILYNEARIDQLYRTLLPDHPPSHPPDMPGEMTTDTLSRAVLPDRPPR